MISEKKTLEQVADFCLGKMLDKKKNKGDLRPYLANVNVRWGEFEFDKLREMRFEQHELIKFGLRYGDIVMCEGGEPGRCAIWKNKLPGMMIQKALHRIRPHECLDNRFLFYTFLEYGQTEQFSRLFTGATIKHLPREKLAQLELEIPPLPVQRKIAAILSEYDDLIENNTRRIAILEEMAQTIYREWFVNFRFPGHENVKLVDSPLGQIPEEWEVVTLGELIDIKHGYAFKGKFFGDSGDFVVLTPGNFHEHGGMKYKGRKEKYYTDTPPEDFVLSRGDLLVAMTDLIQNAPILGSPLFVPETGRFLHNQRLGKVSIKSQELISHEFLFWLFNSYDYRGQIKGSATGSTVRHTSPSRIYEVAFALPPSDLMNQFTLLTKECFSLTEVWAKQTQNLRTTRDLLLPKLISGKLDVEDLDIDVGEAIESLEEAIA